jgi:hypothetical protein
VPRPRGSASERPESGACGTGWAHDTSPQVGFLDVAVWLSPFPPRYSGNLTGSRAVGTAARKSFRKVLNRPLGRASSSSQQAHGLIVGNAINTQKLGWGALIPNRLFMLLSSLANQNWTWQGKQLKPHSTYCLKRPDGSCTQ